MSTNGSGAILLVDDDEGVRTMCRRALESEACVLEADDGQSALDMIQEWPGRLDLVITDIMMPRINGRVLAEVLSIFRPELPVLAMSADPALVDRRLPVLLKPFGVDELIDTARAMRGNTREVRRWARERRAHARQVRAAAEQMRQRVSLVAVARELQRQHPPLR